MTIAALLIPDHAPVVVTTVTPDEETRTLTVQLVATQPTAACPSCDVPATRIHSRYLRTVADLPWADRPVLYQLAVRKFFCDTRTCPRKIFTERLPALVAPWARRTMRLARAQQQIGLTMGGAAGARLAAALTMPASRDVLLTLVRRTLLAPPPATTAIGLDDWALRKGHTYGTVLIDLLTRRPIELLPDRTMERVRDWLQAHPTITIVSRDRATAYAEAARLGAPQAQQVADRWHLLKNLSATVRQVLERYRTAITDCLRPAQLPAAAAPRPLVAAPDQGDPPRPPRHVEQRRVVQAQRQQRYEEIHRLRTQGWSVRAIGRHVGVARNTVRAYLRAEHCPQPAQRPRRRSVLDAYLPYLHERWAAGGVSAAQLYRDLRTHGYPGRASVVKQYVTQLRKAAGVGRHAAPGSAALAVPQRPPSLRTVVGWLLRRPEQRDIAHEEALAAIGAINAELAATITLARAFLALVRDRQPAAFDAWLADVQAGASPRLRTFAKGLLQDESAVRAALALRWSNGPTEGQINRLKLIKRQMYGRASLDLLRQRFLAG